MGDTTVGLQLDSALLMFAEGEAGLIVTYRVFVGVKGAPPSPLGGQAKTRVLLDSREDAEIIGMLATLRDKLTDRLNTQAGLVTHDLALVETHDDDDQEL